MKLCEIVLDIFLLLSCSTGCFEEPMACLGVGRAWCGGRRGGKGGGRLRGQHLLGVSTPRPSKVKPSSNFFLVPAIATMLRQIHAGKPDGSSHLRRQQGPGLSSCFPSPVWVHFCLSYLESKSCAGSAGPGLCTLEKWQIISLDYETHIGTVTLLLSCLG